MCGVLADAVFAAAVGNCVGALREEGVLLQAASRASAATATPKRRSIMA
ncbi:hypothetical protein PXO_04782 [Xanthomonas oryzae pv. oryzae PXO99A]|uniref:Uncharacterized protein n=1 Tax=Xanthomonas oryzae pv. oryzae (strain PXO99A) TaxID=360094 RepID=A0A0K0GIC5_XANOP|nr:hypothetical protein PXO_04782 [Xanthomonas oryzae pv. oryzae PXO99A]